MKRRTLREKQLHLMAKDVLMMKDTMRKWVNFTGVRYLQEHELTDEQEVFLEEITEFINNAIDRLESDENFLKKIILPPIKFPRKKVKA